MKTPFKLDRIEGDKRDHFVFTHPRWRGEWRIAWFFKNREFRYIEYKVLPSSIITTISPCHVTNELLVAAIPDAVMADLIARSHPSHWRAP